MKNVVVIGGGIAGLTAGIYAQRCGASSVILEAHSIPGGNCTSWRRGDYLFEGGMHWLTGSATSQPINEIWRDTGALADGVRVINFDTFCVYDNNGEGISIYRDANMLEKHLLEISPADEKAIRRLCADIRKMSGISMPLMDIKKLKTAKKRKMSPPGLSFFTALLRLSSLSKQSVKEYCAAFKHEGIRNALTQCIGEDYYAVALIMTLAGMNAGDGGFPESGSLPMVGRMARKYAEWGGDLRLRTRAEKVVVENGIAKGVMVKGKLIPADAVIITSDTMAADKLFDMPLDSPWLTKMRIAALPLMNCFVSIGVNADFSDFPHSFMFPLERPIMCGGREMHFMEINNYAGRAGYAPEGKTALTAAFVGDSYDYWQRAKQEGRYESEKNALAIAVIDVLESRYPGISAHIEACDVATPLTYERYCGTWRGSWMTLMKKGSKNSNYHCKINGLTNVYFAGQRMMPPGGLPVAAMTGRTAVQHLCRDFDLTFDSRIIQD